MALFRSHDICHMIFGLGTTLSDETMADTRTLLSCDVGWKRYALYLRTDAQAKALFKELGLLGTALATLRTLPRIVRAIGEARRTCSRCERQARCVLHRRRATPKDGPAPPAPTSGRADRPRREWDHIRQRWRSSPARGRRRNARCARRSPHG